MTTPARINRLAAVNIMLRMCGQAPVNTVEGAVPSIVAIAKNLLTDTQREVLSEGYSFNTTKGVTYTPDTSNGNRIAIPSDVVQADHLTRNITFRDGFFYDADNNTFVFDEPIKLDIIVWLDFDGLPEPAKLYIATSAGRALHRNVIGNPSQNRDLAEDEGKAMVKFKQWEADQTDPNIIRTDVGWNIRGHRRGYWQY